MKFGITFLFCLCIGMSFGESNRNLAVLDFPPTQGLTASDLQLISDRLEAELIQTKAFNVLERRRMGEILQEQGFQNSGACSGSECEMRIGQLLGVDRIVAGSLGKVGNVFSLNLKLVDVSTGKIERSEVLDVKGDISEVLTKSCRVIARKFANLDSASEKKSSAWKWWLGGGVAGLAAVGTVTYILLQPDSKKDPEVIEQKWTIR